MTREERQKVINNLKILKEDYWEDDGYGHETEDYNEMMWSLDMAINELEQGAKTDGDCISRTELLARIDAERKHLLDIKMDGAEHIIVHHARRIIEDMPSVTPQEPKTGRWKYDYTTADGHRTYHCSECGCYLKPKHSEPLNSFKWCSLCGAKMESEG